MQKDLIAEQIDWLDGIVTNPGNPGLFTDEKQAVIRRELAERWPRENRLALLKDIRAKYGMVSCCAYCLNNPRSFFMIIVYCCVPGSGQYEVDSSLPFTPI
jgi:hypothetical protein